MDPKTELGYSLDADLSTLLADAGGTENETGLVSLDDSAVEKLNTENARLEGDTAKVIPESPWYLAIVMVALVGVLTGLLFLIS